MRYSALCLLCLCSWGLQAAIYSMSLPVVWQQKKLGDVKFVLENFSLHAIHTKSFASQFANVINEDLKLTLESDQDGQMNLAELESHGIYVEFDQRNMQVELELEPEALKVDDLTYGDRSYRASPSPSTNFALLNNLNLRYDRTSSNTDEISFEWLADVNLGGHDGINGRFSFFHDNTDTGSESYRGDVRFFYDDYRIPLRYELGDLSSFTRGHLPTINMGGFGFSRSYSDLQPLTKISPSNSQEFHLKQSAEVQVIVNSNTIAKVRLSAGRYDLNDLPLTSGENEVEVLAIYSNGERETFSFSTFYNSSLLQPGLSNFHVNVGFPSEFRNFNYEYLNTPVLSGFYEFGVNNMLTAGVNSLIIDNDIIYGVTTVLGTSYGNFSLRASKSETKIANGYSVSLDTEHSIWGSSPSGASNFRFGYSKSDDFNSSPWQEYPTVTATTAYTLNYNYYISQYLDFNVTGRKSKLQSGSTNHTANMQLSWRYRGFRATAQYRYQDQASTTDPDQHEFFVTFSWNQYNSNSRTRIRTDYNGRNDAVRASYAKVNRNFLNDYGYSVQGEYTPEVESLTASASYTGNRFRVDTTSRYQSREDVKTDDHRVNISTSIAIADGKIGIGNNVRAPFAIVNSHKTLATKQVLINPSPEGEPQAKAGTSVGALINLGSAYTDAALAIDVADAPLGYDWGPGTYNVVGGNNTGHIFTIGSDLSYTAIGYLKDENADAFSLQRGELTGEGQSVSFFTNRKGRFVVEGIGSGEYTVTVGNKAAKVIIEESDKSLIRLGTFTLYEQQEE